MTEKSGLSFEGVFSKDTKNTRVFQELPTGVSPVVSKTIYISHAALQSLPGGGELPIRVKVTIEPVAVAS